MPTYPSDRRNAGNLLRHFCNSDDKLRGKKVTNRLSMRAPLRKYLVMTNSISQRKSYTLLSALDRSYVVFYIIRILLKENRWARRLISRIRWL